MKTQKVLIPLLALAISCKKENDKTANCRIASITQTGTSGNQLFQLTYGEDGRLAAIDQVVGTTSHKDFSYENNTIYIVSLDGNGQFEQKDSITIDNNGRPLNIRQFGSTDASMYTNISFEYNGAELSKYFRTTHPSGLNSTASFTYENGNPVVISEGASSTIIEYYSDKKVQKGDYLELASLIEFGINIYPHKNLVKKMAAGNSIVNFEYEFNADGLIRKVSVSSGNTLTLFNYTYECN